MGHGSSACQVLWVALGAQGEVVLLGRGAGKAVRRGGAVARSLARRAR